VHIRKWATPLVGALTIATAPANATIFSFSGHFSNDTPTPMSSPSCAAGEVLVAFDPSNSTAHGTSNLGDFGPSQTHCIVPGHPYTGTFSFLFDVGDMVSGTTAGYMTPTATPGVFNTFVTYTLTAGTGRFAGGSGTFHGTGLLDRRPARPLNDLSLSGQLNLPGVPEPASWAMMIMGFSLVGATMRSRKTRAALA